MVKIMFFHALLLLKESRKAKKNILSWQEWNQRPLDLLSTERLGHREKVDGNQGRESYPEIRLI